MRLTYKNITQPEPTGFQLRIGYRTKEYSKFYSFNKYGGMGNALEQANKDRDRMLLELKGKPVRQTKASITNKSTGVVGVSRYIYHKKRRNIDVLAYSVNWSDSNGVSRSKQFDACRMDTYLKYRDDLAFSTAKDFRSDWEGHADAGTLNLFNPESYVGWQTW